MNVVPARAVALRILLARRGAAPCVDTSYNLAAYQQEAVGRAREILQRRGGVIIADDVGLGKTYIAAALLEHELSAGRSALVVIPAPLRSAWRAVLSPLGDLRGRIQILTHGQMSRRSPAVPAQFVVIDEAHTFRNPHTHRYRHLNRLCRMARVVLLTATPINNSLSDLYFELRLFARDDSFRDLGIGSLRALLLSGDPDTAALRRLRADVIIRRTRSQLRTNRSLGEVVGRPLDFPEHVQLHTITHAPLVDAAEAGKLLAELEFAIYGDDGSRVLIALSLLKRMQSGHAAALLSLNRLIDGYHQWLAALAAGRLLQVRARPTSIADDQLVLLELVLPPLPASTDSLTLKRLADRDLEVLIRFRDTFARRSDAKLARLAELLAARPPPARTLIFTEFRDTAHALWRTFPHLQVGMITGAEAFIGRQRAPRAEVIRCFAPRANHAAEPPASAAIFVLIATDVLSEGLNLQDAGAVVSYDLPWNPVRLIQRAGRIDRLNSPHNRIDVYNFLPDRDLDELLGLLRRLRTKLYAMRSAVGHDSDVLEPAESMADSQEWLQPAMPDPFDSMLADVDPAQVAPEGSVGSTGSYPQRVLVALERFGVVRELIFRGGSIHEEPSQADNLLRTALLSTFVSYPEVFKAAIPAAFRYLADEAARNQAAATPSGLADVIRHAVQQHALLASPDLLSLADKVLALLPGYLGSAREHITKIRTATTTIELTDALADVVSSCRMGEQAPERAWQLVAAVAAD